MVAAGLERSKSEKKIGGISKQKDPSGATPAAGVTGSALRRSKWERKMLCTGGQGGKDEWM